jgi:uncharacterized membrane protein SirB2
MSRMDAATTWKFLHIVAMFLAVSIFVGQGMLSGAVARSGDVGALRRVLSAEDRFAPVGGAMYLLGIVFGFITAITADFDLTQTWLVISYIIAAFILVNGVTYHRTQAEKLKAAVEAGDGDRARALASAPQRVADERDRRHRLARGHLPDGREAVQLTASSRDDRLEPPEARVFS